MSPANFLKSGKIPKSDSPSLPLEIQPDQQKLHDFSCLAA
jgi:hypothetical protein